MLFAAIFKLHVDVPEGDGIKPLKYMVSPAGFEPATY
jgi:hypothetical protein